MKRITTAFILGILLFSSDIFAQQNPANLIGEWELSFQETLNLMSPDTKSKYDSIDSSIQNQIESQLSSQFFTFSSDTTFQITANGSLNNGSWNITNGQLILTFLSGAQTSQTIESLSEDRLILTIVNDPDSEALFKRVYLLKNSN